MGRKESRGEKQKLRERVGRRKLRADRQKVEARERWKARKVQKLADLAAEWKWEAELEKKEA